MKFKVKDIIYIVWDYEHITKEKIQCIDEVDYIVYDYCLSNDKNSFAKLNEAKAYARKLLDKHILKVSKYIDNVKPKLNS